MTPQQRSNRSPSAEETGVLKEAAFFMEEWPRGFETWWPWAWLPQAKGEPSGGKREEGSLVLSFCPAQILLPSICPTAMVVNAWELPRFICFLSGYLSLTRTNSLPSGVILYTWLTEPFYLKTFDASNLRILVLMVNTPYSILKQLYPNTPSLPCWNASAGSVWKSSMSL